jgi:hypothetical protein
VARPGQFDCDFKARSIYILRLQCIVHRVNRSATYLFEGDGHHELVADQSRTLPFRMYNVVVRDNGKIQPKAKNSG